MKVITYLSLTMLSIVVQFTVIQFIEGKIKPDKEDSKDLTVASQNEDEDVNLKPHALYYRSPASNLKDNKSPSTTEYFNVTLLQTTTDTTYLTTTIIDELYDDNTSLTGTTEVTYTTAEFENVTEISLFDKKNNTGVKPNILPKKTIITYCSCNLLYQVCDINCCCDSDCSDTDLKMFKCGDVKHTSINLDDAVCQTDIYNLYRDYGNRVMDMFCIAKTNLPDRRNVKREKHDRNAVERNYKWHLSGLHQSPNTFKRKLYMYGDHVWVLKNGTIKYMDLPIPVFNSYCTGRKPLTFLKEETIKCSVKLKVLEMFEIVKASQEATIVSVLESTSNASTLNCSTMHCTNWTIIVCDGAECVNYNKSIHEPSCTDINCTNLALEFDYIFYYHDFKIINATIKLHTRKILNIMPFMIQKINVRFVIANGTVVDLVRMSGNPGYLEGLPVIVSYNKENHSESFYNRTASHKYIMHPENDNGICKITNGTNYLTFNTIKRMKCRFQCDEKIVFNDTSVCKAINNGMVEFFGINKMIYISPYGNPQHLNDTDWIPLLNDMADKEPVYGEFNGRVSKLHCYNMVTSMSYVFTFADTGENNLQKLKILSGKINLTAGNVTLYAEETSLVFTIDVIFIDETKPNMYEYAAGPNLNIHLPKDFFFPFPNSRSNNRKCNVISIFFISVFVLQQIK